MDRRDDKRALISEEAAEWLVRLKDDRLSSAERRKYLRWLKQSPAHIAEMIRVSGLRDGLASAKLAGFVATPEAESNVVELRTRDAAGIDLAHQTAHSGWRLPRRGWRPALASIALAVLASLTLKLFWFDGTIATDIGEWRRVTLDDGSVVNVGPRSRLDVDFDTHRRSVYLSRGEALFQVSKDPARPFYVNADLAVVRAVGTQFAVTRRDDRVLVTVKEGKVAVSQGSGEDTSLMHEGHAGGDDGQQSPSTLALVADQQIQISSRNWPVKVLRVDAKRELAWAQGQLIFDAQTTVGEAADEFNRRNRIQIVVADPVIAARHVCCVFSVDDPESFAQSVAIARDVELVREGTDVLKLIARTEPQRMTTVE